MDGLDMLEKLKVLLEETDDGCRVLSDQQLAACLVQADGDLYGAAYYGALRKAQEDGISLPDGLDLPSSRDYWLRLAQSYRPNKGGPIPRADDRRR